jgi:hypothetical protein
MRNSIGGTIDYRDLYRPQTRAGLAAAVRELHSRGLRPRDIAGHLRLSLTDVLAALREPRL